MMSDESIRLPILMQYWMWHRERLLIIIFNRITSQKYNIIGEIGQLRAITLSFWCLGILSLIRDSEE